MKPKDVQYLTDAPERWKKALDDATTWEQLETMLYEWRELCPDAYAARPTTHNEFVEFSDGLRKERKGRFAGERWAQRFGALLIPSKLMEVSIVADQYRVPWGTAYIRLEEVRKGAR